jgi:hypothetical protein
MSPLRTGVAEPTTHALPLIDDGTKVIRFRSRAAASSRRAAAWGCGPTGESEVIRFRPRGTAPGRELALGSWDVDDLRKYEYPREGDDDYRRRMVVNVFAAAVLVVLMITGDWIVSTLAMTRDSQDCYRPGASNCAAIYMPRRHG